MAPRAPALVLVLLLLGLPAAPAGAAEAPLGVQATMAPGTSWALVALDVTASDWQEEDGFWSLSLRLAVEGIGQESLTATDVVLENEPFGYHPFIHPGTGGMWVTYGTSAPPQDQRAIAIVATEPAPASWTLRLALAHDIDAELPTVAPLAQGAGAQVAAHLAFGADVAWSSGVVAERGADGLMSTVELSASLPASGPSLQSVMGVWAMDAGAAHLATRAAAADREVEDGRRLVAPLVSGWGATATGPGTTGASVQLAASYFGDEGFTDVELVSIPVDLAAIGLRLPSLAGDVSVTGIGGSVWIAGCTIPADALADEPIRCVREL